MNQKKFFRESYSK